MSAAAVDWESKLDQAIAERNRCSFAAWEHVVASHSRMRGQLAASHRTAANASGKAHRLESEVKKLQEMLTDVQQGNGARTARDLERDKQIVELQAQLSRAEKDRGDMYKMMYEKQNAEKQLTEAMRRLEDNSSQIKALTMEVEQLKEQLGRHEETIAIVRRENEQLVCQRATLEEQLRACREEAVVRERQILQHCKEKAELMDERFSLEERLTDLMNSNGSKAPTQSSPFSSLLSSNSEARFAKDVGVGSGSSIVPSYVSHAVEATMLECYSMTVVESGRAIWTGGNDRTLRCWDSQSLTATHRMDNLQYAPLCVDSLSDRLVAGGPDGVCRLYNLTANRLSGTLTGHTDKITSVCLGPTHHQAISASSDRTMRVWDADNVATIRSILCPNMICDVSLADERVCSSHYDGALRIWDLRGSGSVPVAVVSIHEPKKAVTCAKWAPDRNRIISLGRDNTVRVTDARMWQQVGPTLAHDKFSLSSNIVKLGISPDGNFVACGSSSGSLFVWPLASTSADTAPRVHMVPDQHSGQILQVLWLPDGRSVATMGLDKRLCLWK